LCPPTVSQSKPLIKLVLQCEFEYLAIQVRMGGNIVG
jgi:hypothetical protein